MLHAAMLEESSRLSLQHKSAIAGTLLKMFGSISVNGLVFLSIFNGVSSLASHKVCETSLCLLLNVTFWDEREMQHFAQIQALDTKCTIS